MGMDEMQGEQPIPGIDVNLLQQIASFSQAQAQAGLTQWQQDINPELVEFLRALAGLVENPNYNNPHPDNPEVVDKRVYISVPSARMVSDAGAIEIINFLKIRSLKLTADTKLTEKKINQSIRYFHKEFTTFLLGNFRKFQIKGYVFSMIVDTAVHITETAMFRSVDGFKAGLSQTRLLQREIVSNIQDQNAGRAPNVFARLFTGGR